MTAINFDQPSKGEISDTIPTLTVTNNGDGEAVHASSESHQYAAINSYSPNYEAVHAETYSEKTAAIAAYQRNSTTNNPVAALYGYSERGEGVHAESKSDQHAALTGWHKNKKLAGYFHGDVAVTGDVRLVNADCAEEFDITSDGTVEPGTVMVINQSGILERSEQPYDKRVAGIVCGAGDYKPGIILDKKENRINNKKRLPIALIGKVYCKVDADYFSVEVGDLLTSSFTMGHAMKANDPIKAFGAVIGKALKPLEKGRGMI